MKTTRFAKHTFTAIALALLCTVATVHAQEKTKISIAVIATPVAPTVAGTIGELKKALESAGNAEVTLYGPGSPYSVPGKLSELVEQGAVDMAFGVQQFEAGRFPLNLLMAEPFMVDDHVKGSRSYMKALRNIPEITAEYRPNRVLNVALASGEQIHARRHVGSIDELKGLRVMVTNPGMMAIVRAVGGNVVALPLPAQYENLQKGVVDAASSSWTSQLAFKTIEVTSYHLQLHSVATPIYLVMNQKKYESLPPELRKVIDEFSTEEAAARFSSVWTRVDEAAIAEAKKRNHETVVIEGTARDALRNRFQPLTDARLLELDQKGLPARRIYDSLVKQASQ